MGGYYNRHNEIQNFENLYSRIIKNQDGIDKLIETNDPPKLNQEDTNNLNRSKISNEIQTFIKNLTTKKSPSPDGFTAEFYQNFKEKLVSVLPNSFYQPSITLIPQPKKKKKL
jgi:hypothetical protein